MSVLRDRFGVAIEASDEEAVRVLDEAVLALVRLAGEPVMLAERASALDPALVLARAFSAYLHLYAGSEREADKARQLLEDLSPAAPRERAHAGAARAWASGDLELATRLLESALLEDPRDLLALKVAQDLYLSLGDRVNLRDVAARVLPSWPQEADGSGYVRAMHAFGLEESGEYGAALAQATSALAADPSDVWAVHAVLHVHEMEGSPAEGLSFATASSPHWDASFFAVHNWWHAGLFHLGLGEDEEATSLYDSRIADSNGAQPLAALDAASLLWRLSLLGAMPEGRAVRLLPLFEPMIGDSTDYFSDWHAAMCFGMAGRTELNDALAADVADRRHGSIDEAVRNCGLELVRGFAAFSTGRVEDSVHLLSAVRPHAYRVGGSHAQRDVLDLTLLAAASATGETRLVRALLAERGARSASATALGRRVAETNRPPRRKSGTGSIGANRLDDASRAGDAPAPAGADGPGGAGGPDGAGGRDGADALQLFGEFDLLEEEAAELGVGRRGAPYVRRQRVETPDGALSAVVWGDRPIEAVLLHGLALNAHTWDGVALALGRPLAALDLPGHGDSDWRGDGSYVAGTIAPSVAAAVATLAGGGTTLVGHSLGGLTAIEVSRLEPDLVAAIVLVDVSPGLRARRASTVRAFLAGPESFGSREEIVERAMQFGYGRSRAALERGVWHNTVRRPDGSVVWKHHVGQLPGGGAAPSSLTGLWQPLEDFGARGGKLLLVWAEEGFLDDDDAAELAARVPGARVVRVPGGHNVQEAEPVRLAAILRQFLDQSR
jgi:pimeloyl-ACP methyl ester carboxylesterase/tetratricopeptide (TPR) repeat protein